MDYDRPKKISCIRVRLIITFLASFCPIVCYISRQNLSMAMVAMVDDSGVLTAVAQLNSTSTTEKWLAELDAELNENARGSAKTLDDTSCPIETVTDESGQTTSAISFKSYGAKYHWESADKSLILSAFFWTYVLFQIPAARMAERIGAKWILATSAIGSCVLSFASPWAASVHAYALAFVRALMGVCQTALFPACYVLYAKWLPPVERSLAIPILNVGAYVGSVFASSLTGYFSEQEQFGWEYAFYTPGLLCGLWFLAWLWNGANEPREHKTISLEEIVQIESKMENRNDLGQRRKDIDWFKLFKSGGIWAMVAAFFSSNWSFTIVLLLIPTYLNDILHIPPFKNGLINSTIYVLYCVASPVVSSGSTMMVETRAFGLSRLNVRKLMESVALFGQAVCFVALPLIGCNQTWVLATLFLQIVLFSFTSGGEVHLPTELSVDFSGTIYAVGNCIGSSTGFIAPFLHSAIVSNSHNRAQWDTFFYLTALICAIGGLIFMLFGQNQLQDFSKTCNESQLDICEPSKSVSEFSLASSSFALQQQRYQQSAQIRRQAPLAPPSIVRSLPSADAPIFATTTRAAWMVAAIKQHNNGAGS